MSLLPFLPLDGLTQLLESSSGSYVLLSSVPAPMDSWLVILATEGDGWLLGQWSIDDVKLNIVC
jgi:hypothetical protein